MHNLSNVLMAPFAY